VEFMRNLLVVSNIEMELVDNSLVVLIHWGRSPGATGATLHEFV
jgi:hypothetical protein